MGMWMMEEVDVVPRWFRTATVLFTAIEISTGLFDFAVSAKGFYPDAVLLAFSLILRSLGIPVIEFNSLTYCSFSRASLKSLTRTWSSDTGLTFAFSAFSLADAQNGAPLPWYCWVEHILVPGGVYNRLGTWAWLVNTILPIVYCIKADLLLYMSPAAYDLVIDRLTLSRPLGAERSNPEYHQHTQPHRFIFSFSPVGSRFHFCS